MPVLTCLDCLEFNDEQDPGGFCRRLNNPCPPTRLAGDLCYRPRPAVACGGQHPPRPPRANVDPLCVPEGPGHDPH